MNTVIMAICTVSDILSLDSYLLVPITPLIIHVPESAKIGHRVGPSISQILNAPLSLNYFLHSSKLFRIEGQTGQISLKRQCLDFESGHIMYNLTIGVMHNGFSISQFNVTVMVDNVIDEHPVFSKTVYIVDIPSKSHKDTKLVQFEIYDNDQRDKHSIEVTSVKPKSDIFSFDQSSMSMFVDGSGGLSEPAYEVMVRASDLAGFTAEATVLVSVHNQKETLQFDYKTFVQESTLSIFVIDSTMYSQCRCLDSREHRFQVQKSNENHWEIWLVENLDYERNQLLNLTVACQNSNSQIVAIYHYQIVVMDANDNSPVFPILFLQYSFSENLKHGSIQIPLEAVDSDSKQYGEVTRYYLDPPTPGFVVTYNLKLKQHYITNTHSLDYETLSEYTLTIFAQDGSGLVSETPLTIRLSVTDQNDNAPIFEKEFYSINVSHNYFGPTLQVLARDEDSLSAVKYELHSPYDFVTVHPDTGLISIAPHSICTVHSSLYVGYVVAMDENGRTSAPSMFEISVELELNECL